MVCCSSWRGKGDVNEKSLLKKDFSKSKRSTSIFPKFMDVLQESWVMAETCLAVRSSGSQLGVLAEQELALKLWVWPRASNESVSEADPNRDLNLVADPNGIKCRRQSELSPGCCVDWSNGALGDLSYWLQERLTEVVEKTETSRTEVHRRCNLTPAPFLFPLLYSHSSYSFWTLLNAKPRIFLISLTLEQNWKLYREEGNGLALDLGWKLFSHFVQISKVLEKPFCPDRDWKVKIWNILVNWKSGKEQ